MGQKQPDRQRRNPADCAHHRAGHHAAVDHRRARVAHNQIRRGARHVVVPPDPCRNLLKHASFPLEDHRQEIPQAVPPDLPAMTAVIQPARDGRPHALFLNHRIVSRKMGKEMIGRAKYIEEENIAQFDEIFKVMNTELKAVAEGGSDDV
jgi:hypothetical protein